MMTPTKSETKHTPGPWSATSDPMHFDSRTDVADANGGMIASMCGVNPARSVFEMEANARLIAAAPDLLDALKMAKETIRAWHGPNAWEIYDRVSPEMRAINSAISKAEGSQP